MKYRKEIDGIRAVAVLPVLLFHAGIEQFSGGYIGVDMFFVVSGFLITSIFLVEKEERRFSILRFYERRARRLLPAIFLVVSITMLFAWLWMTPAQLKILSGSALSVVFYVSNFFFWQQGGYFSVASEQMPLLHTWSLSVEEQFYVVFPIFMVLIWRLGTRTCVAVITAVVLLSFALAEWGSREFPSAAYYLAPTRVWQLLAGVLAAYYLAKNQGFPRQQSDWASILGLGLVVFAICTFDDATPYPGIYALVPVVGTLLIILYGGSDTRVGRLLSAAPMVWIGLLSYSIYLWHQPLFAYARILGVSSDAHWVYILLGCASVLLAYLTWRYVENPFRNRQRISRSVVFRAATAAAVATGSCAAIAMSTNVGEWRWTPDQLEVLAYSDYPRQQYYRERSCFLLPGQVFEDFAPECFAKTSSSFVVWGDSHAASLHMGLFEKHRSHDAGQFTIAACPPIAGLEATTNRTCSVANEDILNQLFRSIAEKIVIAANWRFYRDYEGWDMQLHSTVMQLTDLGKEVYIVGSLPQWRPSLPILIARDMRDRNMKLSEVGNRYGVRDWDELQALDRRLSEIAQLSNAYFVPLISRLCGGRYCDAIVDDSENRSLIAWDHSHLTLEGSKYVSEALYPAIMREAQYAGEALETVNFH